MRHFLAVLPLVAGGSGLAGDAPAAEQVHSGDGLSMTLDGRGRVVRVEADGQSLMPSGRAGGFYVGEYRVDPGPELVANGDFAGPLEFETTGGWRRDTERFRSAGASLRLDAAEGGQASIPVQFEANRVYRIRFHLLTASLEAGPIMHVRRRDAAGNIIYRQANLSHLGIYYPQWVAVEHTIQTLEGTAGGEMMIHVPGSRAGTLWIDDLSVQELRLPELEALEGQIVATGEGAEFRGEWQGVRVTARFRGGDGRVAITGQLEDTTGRDRAIQLAWRLPVQAEGWTWQNTLDRGQTVEPGRQYTTVTEIGRNTNRFISRLPYTSLDGPQVGLSLAVPMDRPSVYRISYTSTGEYAIQHDFGLTRDTSNFPGRAEFSFLLSRHDPRWGLRSAAEKYFEMFPEFFQVRTRPGSVFSSALIAQVPDLRDFGAMYADRRNFANKDYLKRVDDAGMYSMTYGEPWMWRSNLPDHMPHSEVPPVDQLLARELADVDEWDRPDVRDYHFVPRAWSVRAFLNSVYHDEHGRPVMNANRSYGGGRSRVVEWVTNADPKIQGPFGEPNRGLLSWEREFLDDVQSAAERGTTRPPGVRYDSISEWVHMGAENHRHEHFATATVPLTFSYRTGRPVQIGYFTAVEHMRFVRQRTLEMESFVYANEARSAPWFMNLLDGMFRESWQGDRGVEVFQHVRSLAYQKNVGDWRRIRMDEPVEMIVQKLNHCLTYAWWPGYHGTAEEFERHRGLFRQYVPVFEALALAGWEPVPHAVAEPEQVVLERFGGRPGRPLYFTVRNTGSEERQISVKIDLESLGYRPGEVSDPLTGEALDSALDAKTGELSVAVTVPPQWTRVLKVDQRDGRP